MAPAPRRGNPAWGDCQVYPKMPIRLPSAPGTRLSTPKAQRRVPIPPQAPSARVLDRNLSVFAGYHPSKRTIGTTHDRGQIGAKPAWTSPESILRHRLGRRGAQTGTYISPSTLAKSTPSRRGSSGLGRRRRAVRAPVGDATPPPPAPWQTGSMTGGARAGRPSAPAGPRHCAMVGAAAQLHKCNQAASKSGTPPTLTGVPKYDLAAELHLL